MERSNRTELQDALDSMVNDTCFYSPIDIGVALDSLAATLRKIFLKPNLFESASYPSLEDVLTIMIARRLIDGQAHSDYYKIVAILDRYKYPKGREIEDTGDIEEAMLKLTHTIEGLLT